MENKLTPANQRLQAALAKGPLAAWAVSREVGCVSQRERHEKATIASSASARDAASRTSGAVEFKNQRAHQIKLRANENPDVTQVWNS